MQPLDDGSAIGRFRVSSPVTAQGAADLLNGMMIDGVAISADWTNGDGSAPSRPPQSAADAAGGQLASFTATAAIPADDQPATTTTAPMPALPAAEEHTASSQTSAIMTTAAAPATIAVASPTTQLSVVQPLHMPPSPLLAPAPETPSLPEPFALPASSYSTPATFVANVTPSSSPATVTKGLPSTSGDLWGQELQGRRKAKSDGGGEEERAAKRRK
ncbi:hypothetical protein JCM10296v2_004858 [Rhodotorula toruloides]